MRVTISGVGLMINPTRLRLTPSVVLLGVKMVSMRQCSERARALNQMKDATTPNPWFLALVMLIPISLALVPMLGTQETDAQLVDIDVDGAERRVIGDEPRRAHHGVYRVRQRWVPRSLAVYLDGKRCERGQDYTVDLRDREIIFTRHTDDDSVVIVDYEGR